MTSRPTNGSILHSPTQQLRRPPNIGTFRNVQNDAPPPMSEVKPLLMEKPQYFEGTHDDIEHFPGDCKTYFEVFRQHYMQHPVLMVVLASSLFRGATQDWWVHLCEEYEYTPKGSGDYDDDAPFNDGPRY